MEVAGQILCRVVRVAIWPFSNCLPEIKWFGHLAIFWPFLNDDKNSTFKDLFWTNLSKFQTFYEIIDFNLVIF
jgi:hypothetical protein